VFDHDKTNGDDFMGSASVTMVIWRATYVLRGCQMVYFYTQNPNLGKTWWAL
jgi:hypothetical protein